MFLHFKVYPSLHTRFGLTRLIQSLIVCSRSVLRTRKSQKPASRASRRWTSAWRKTSPRVRWRWWRLSSYYHIVISASTRANTGAKTKPEWDLKTIIVIKSYCHIIIFSYNDIAISSSYQQARRRTHVQSPDQSGIWRTMGRRSIRGGIAGWVQIPN